MNKLLTKSNLLASVISVSMLGMLATGASAASDSTSKEDTRANKMLEKSTEAANAAVSASQAVSIALKQVANSNAVAVRYHDGNSRGMRGLDKVFSSTDAVPSYHVLLIDTDGKHFHTQIDASTGKVLETEEKQKPPHFANDDADKKPPIPTVSLEQAMQAAVASVGGEAVGAGFGKPGMRGKHGQHSHHHGKGHGHGNMSNGERPDPSYHVRVLKDSEVYMVKVDGESGKVVDTKTMDEMKQMREQMRQGGHDGMRGERR